MIYLMEKAKVISMKQEGLSNRAIAKKTGHDRSTIAKIWNAYCALSVKLTEQGADKKTIQAAMTETPPHQVGDRCKRKYTEQLDERLKAILDDEKKKDRLMGPTHKQKLTNKQIHAKLCKEGFDISLSTINVALSGIRKRQKEVFIRQTYDFGDRLEYDFGEVFLDCGEVDEHGKGVGVKTYHMAVLSSPGASFRWLYLYTNQKKAVFMDSHVRFFEMIGGCHKEIVYDNMRNVVSKFIGKNEKELNADLMKMSMYYGFQINVTNCFKGNEKGYVEGSVKTLRNQLFSDNYRFASLADAQEYAQSQLLKFNENSQIEEEKKQLLAYKPPLELATISENKVNTGSMICVDTVFYSVPEYLVGKQVIVKKYHDEIRVYAANELVCQHQRAFGNGTMQVDIYHYLNTLLKKPGALRNSIALKSIPRLKAIFDTYYSKQPKKFIEIFLENKALDVDEIVALFQEKSAHKGEILALSVVKPISQVTVSARVLVANYALLINGGLK